MDITGYIDAIMRFPMETVDGEQVLDALFEYYDSNRKLDSKEIRAAYERFYEQINHKPIREIIPFELPLFALVNQYEIRGFKEGVKVGLMLANELNT